MDNNGVFYTFQEETRDVNGVLPGGKKYPKTGVTGISGNDAIIVDGDFNGGASVTLVANQGTPQQASMELWQREDGTSLIIYSMTDFQAPEDIIPSTYEGYPLIPNETSIMVNRMEGKTYLQIDRRYKGEGTTYVVPTVLEYDESIKGYRNDFQDLPADNMPEALARKAQDAKYYAFVRQAIEQVHAVIEKDEGIRRIAQELGSVVKTAAMEEHERQEEAAEAERAKAAQEPKPGSFGALVIGGEDNRMQMEPLLFVRQDPEVQAQSNLPRPERLLDIFNGR